MLHKYLGRLIVLVISSLFTTVVTLAVLGGLGYYFLWTYGSTPVGDADPEKRRKTQLEQNDRNEKQSEKHRDTAIEVEGWLTVRHTFKSAKDANTLFGQKEEEEAEQQAQKSYTLSSRLGMVYRSAMDMQKNKAKQEGIPKDFFYCILRGNVLFIYDRKGDEGGDDKDKTGRSCLAALSLGNYDVNLETADGPFKDIEGRVYSKRNAITLRLAKAHQGLPVVGKGMSTDMRAHAEQENGPWFMFAKSPSMCENWYLAALKVSASPPSYAKSFSYPHMNWLVQTVVARSDPSGLGWLNALIGRIFLGINRTAFVERFIQEKINKKLAQINSPIIGPLVATEVNVGDTPPLFSHAMLKTVDQNGEMMFEAQLTYQQPKEVEGQGIRITIEATKLGVTAMLSAVVKSLSGNVRVLVKPPPSNRLWWCFTDIPKMDIKVEPVVGTRLINMNMVTNFIERKMREGMAEAVVFPNMDDFAFFPTESYPVRGGIYDEMSKIAVEEAEEARGEEKVYPGTEEDQEKSSIKSDDSGSIKSERPKQPKKQQTMGPGTPSSDEPHMGVQRSVTTPALGPPADQHKAGKSKLGWANRPASTRSASKGSSAEEELRQTKSADISPSGTPTNELIVSSKKTDTPISSKAPTPPPASSEVNATAVDTDSISSSGRESPATTERGTTPGDAPAGHQLQSMNTTQLFSAVRAGDKTVLKSQAFVAKDNIKKWGISYLAKRADKAESRRKEIHEENEAAAGGSYYVPTPDEEPHPTHQPHRSLQERLNAAAAGATSPVDASARRLSSTSSQFGTSPTATSTRPRTGSNGEESIAQPPSARSAMVVPHMPKRPGVVTSIANDPTVSLPSKAAPPALPVRKATVLAPKISRGDSDPVPAKHAPVDLNSETASMSSVATGDSESPLMSPAHRQGAQTDTEVHRPEMSAPTSRAVFSAVGALMSDSQRRYDAAQREADRAERAGVRDGSQAREG